MQLALTPDGRWGYPTAELVSAAGAAGFNAVGINADWVDEAAVESYRSAGLLCHEVLALIVGDDETATLRAARRLADAASTMRATWVLTVFTAPVSARTEQLIRHCAAIIADAGAAMAVEFSPLGPVSSIKAGLDAVRAASRGGRAGLMIDSWHFWCGESTWHELAAVPLDDIAYVQFTDALVPESRERLVRETLHRRALPGQGVLDLHRFGAAGQPLALPEVARILRTRLGDGATRVPKREAPDWLVRAAARFVPPLEGLAALLGEPKQVSTAKATNVLGWQPRPTADTVADTGESLLRLHSR